MRACEQLDLDRVSSPAYVIDLRALERNLELLAHAQEAAGLHDSPGAQGVCCVVDVSLVAQVPRRRRCERPRRGAARARRARQAGPHLLPRLRRGFPSRVDSIIRTTSSSTRRLTIERFRAIIDEHKADTSFGIRINPQHSEVDVALYDPCAPGSRLGATKEQLVKANLRGIDGLHFHTLCELGRGRARANARNSRGGAISSLGSKRQSG